MQARLRLRGDKTFNEIHQTGRNVANKFLVLRTLPNKMDHNRFGILVSKRIGNSVTRNRLRRRIREILRHTNLYTGWDIVFIARKGIEQVNFHQCKEATDNLLKRCDLLSH